MVKEADESEAMVDGPLGLLRKLKGQNRLPASLPGERSRRWAWLGTAEGSGKAGGTSVNAEAEI